MKKDAVALSGNRKMWPCGGRSSNQSRKSKRVHNRAVCLQPSGPFPVLPYSWLGKPSASQINIVEAQGPALCIHRTMAYRLSPLGEVRPLLNLLDPMDMDCAI